MNVAFKLEQLARRIRRASNVFVQLDLLDSGIAYLRAGPEGRHFLLAFYPKYGGFGVDEVRDDDGFEMGYRNWFAGFEEAERCLLELLAASGVNVESGGPP